MTHRGGRNRAARRHPDGRSGRAGWARGAALAAALLLLVVAPLQAHTELRWARPADGETLATSPAEIRLRFTSPVEARFTRIRLLGPDGAEIPLPAPDASEGRREFASALETALPGGIYTVEWQTTAADGHVIRGTLRFTVEGPAAPADTAADPAAPPAEPAPPPPAPIDPAAGVAAGDPVAVAVRFLHYLALLLLIGAAAFRLGVLGRGGAGAGLDGAAARARGVAWGALALLAPVIVARLWLQGSMLALPGEAWHQAGLGTLLTSTTWGTAWLLQVASAAVVAGGLLLARGGAAFPGWGVAAVGVLGLSAVPALSGHAAAVEGVGPFAVVNDTAHVLGAGAWLGTLAVLLLAGLPGALRAAPARPGIVADLVGRFSPVALAAASLVVVTGVVNALLHLGAPAELWTTGYGRLVLLKTGLLLPVLALGAYHWRFVRPALAQRTAAERLQRSAAVELAIAGAVLLVTAVLVAVPPP